MLRRATRSRSKSLSRIEQRSAPGLGRCQVNTTAATARLLRFPQNGCRNSAELLRAVGPIASISKCPLLLRFWPPTGYPARARPQPQLGNPPVRARLLWRVDAKSWQVTRPHRADFHALTRRRGDRIGLCLLRCISPFMARLRHAATSAVWSPTGGRADVARTNFGSDWPLSGQL